MAQQQDQAAASLTQLGQINGAGNKRALYLKLFSGEMFKGFQHNTIARDLVTKRTLKNGRSLQFIYTGRTSAEYHTPGKSILGNSDGAPPVAEKTITCDDLLISSAFVYELDETLAHYDLRGEISRKIGYALAEKYDRNIFRAITKSARQASPVTKENFIEPGGAQVQIPKAGESAATSDAYNADNLVKAFYESAAVLDEKGVSSEGRVAVLNPRQYYELIKNVGSNALNLINRDATGSALQSGQGIFEIAGIKIYKSMNIPFLGKFGTDLGAAAGASSAGSANGSFIGNNMDDGTGETVNNYGDGRPTGNASEADTFKHSCGLIFQKEAAGVVEAIGPQVQVTSGDVSVVYQGDVILGRLAMGADFLNPACAVELVAGITPSRHATTQAATTTNAGAFTTTEGTIATV